MAEESGTRRPSMGSRPIDCTSRKPPDTAVGHDMAAMKTPTTMVRIVRRARNIPAALNKAIGPAQRKAEALPAAAGMARTLRDRGDRPTGAVTTIPSKSILDRPVSEKDAVMAEASATMKGTNVATVRNMVPVVEDTANGTSRAA